MKTIQRSLLVIVVAATLGCGHATMFTRTGASDVPQWEESRPFEVYRAKGPEKPYSVVGELYFYSDVGDYPSESAKIAEGKSAAKKYGGNAVILYEGRTPPGQVPSAKTFQDATLIYVP